MGPGSVPPASYSAAVDSNPRGRGSPAPALANRNPRLELRPAVVVGLTLLAFVATDYKFRRRSLAESVSGSADLAVLAELGMYAVIATGLLFVVGRVPVGIRDLGPATRWLVAFAAVCASSTLWSPYASLAAVRSGQFAILTAGALVLARHGTVQLMHTVTHAFLGLTVASALLGVVFRYDYRLDTQLAEPIPRYSWFVVHPVVAGLYLATAIVLAAGYARRVANGALWPPWVYRASIVVCAVALAATKTRASMGAAVIGLVVLFVLTVRKVHWIDVAAVVACVLALVVVVAGSDIGDFLRRGQSTEELGSFSSRTVLWSQAIDKWEESPIAGYGVQSARALFYETTGLGGGHNAIINVLVETGTIGILCWGAVVGGVALGLRRLWSHVPIRSEVGMLAAVFVTHLLNAMTYEGLGSLLNVALIWLLVLVAWVEVLERRRRDDLASVDELEPA
jgi:O-antigen ligase